MYAWSNVGRTAHLSDCPSLSAIRGDNVRFSDDLAVVHENCWYACPRCLGGILPRVSYEHALPEHATWVWTVHQRVAHRPTCGILAFVRPESLRWTDDPAELRRACRRGCRLCRTITDLPQEESESETALIEWKPAIFSPVIVVQIDANPTETYPIPTRKLLQPADDLDTTGLVRPTIARQPTANR